MQISLPNCLENATKCPDAKLLVLVAINAFEKTSKISRKRGLFRSEKCQLATVLIPRRKQAFRYRRWPDALTPTTGANAISSVLIIMALVRRHASSRLILSQSMVALSFVDCGTSLRTYLPRKVSPGRRLPQGKDSRPTRHKIGHFGNVLSNFIHHQVTEREREKNKQTKNNIQ